MKLYSLKRINSRVEKLPSIEGTRAGVVEATLSLAQKSAGHNKAVPQQGVKQSSVRWLNALPKKGLEIS